MATEHATTSATRPGPAARRRKLWWRVRLVVWPLLLIWFGWFAYVRWTTPPPAFVDGPVALEQQRDPFSDLNSAISTLPPYRPTGGSPGGPWQQAESLRAALRGPWDPASRQDQADAVKYLSNPRVSKGLDRVVEACDDLRAMGPDRPRNNQAGASSAAFWGGLGADSTITALTIRARLQHAVQQDLVGALSNLRAGLYLHMLAREMQLPYYITHSGACPAVLELLYVARELDLPPTFATEMIHFLSDELPFSLSAALASRGLRVTDIQGFLDRHYTDDGHGNGWLVLSTVDMSFFGMTATRPEQRSGFWNLFSPFFNDRRTVAAKFAGLDSEFREFDRLDYAAACEALRRGSRVQTRLSILDGPLIEAVGDLNPAVLEPAFADVTWRRAAVVILALSAYKHERGQYPARLGELVPDYIGELPNDLLTASPFIYERTGPHAYGLRPAKPASPDLSLHNISDPGILNIAEYSISRPAADE